MKVDHIQSNHYVKSSDAKTGEDIFTLGTRVPLRTQQSFSLYVFEKDHIAAISTLWKELEHGISDVGLTVAWDWVESWLEAYGDMIDYWFIAGFRKNELIGLSLITKETQRPIPFPVKAFHIGTYGEPYREKVQMTNNRFLVKKHYTKEFSSVLIEAVLSYFNPEEIVFDELASSESDELLNIVNDKRYAFAEDKDSMLYMDFEQLRKNGQTVSEAFSSSMRYAVRRTGKALGDLTIEWPETLAEALNIFDELVILYTKRLRKLDREGKFASARYTEFQRNIIKKRFDKKQALLFRVKSKQYGTLGCYYFLVDRGIAYFIQISLNDFDSMDFGTISKDRLKIGYLVHALFMEECFKHGLMGYSFSTGIFPYKLQLTNSREKVSTIAIRRSIKPAFRDIVMKLYVRLDDNRKASVLIRILRGFVYGLTARLTPKSVNAL